jgi:hypothetical protein
MTTISAHTNQIMLKQSERERIARDVEAFIASGRKPYVASPHEYEHTEIACQAMRYRTNKNKEEESNVIQ